MKKLILLAAVSLMFSQCKKEDPQPAQTTQTSSGPQKWHYTYNFNKPNDPNMYQGDDCLTESEMLTRKQLVGAYNIQRWGKC